jgi:hypothetical protein
LIARVVVQDKLGDHASLNSAIASAFPLITFTESLFALIGEGAQRKPLRSEPSPAICDSANVQIPPVVRLDRSALASDSKQDRQPSPIAIQRGPRGWIS